MPVTTRSKSKKSIEDKVHNESNIMSVKLKDITNSKKQKITNNIKHALKLKNIQAEAVLSQQKTVIIPRMTSTQLQNDGIAKIPTQNQSQIEDTITMMRKIKKLLECNFKNVAERLQLDPVPPCLYDLRKCHFTHHSKNSVSLAPKKQKTLNYYLLHEQFFQFNHSVRHSLCGHDEFPGTEVLIKMLEKIMVRDFSTTKLKFNNFFYRNSHRIRKIPSITSPHHSFSPNFTIFS